MPFRVVSEPQVSRSIPEPGGDFDVSFELAAIGKDTHVLVTYDIVPEHPYVFVPPTSPLDRKRVGPEPRTIFLTPTRINRHLRVAKSPAGAPRVEQLFIDIEVTEVDASGEPTTLPGGLVLPPRKLSAVITII